ncbi:hypothetical protein MMC29_002809 [Sticta canariensis]|nr:hypothetical protein [Sticta canariensis]
MIIRQFHGWNASLVIYLFVLLRLVAFAKASQGDRLPEFRRCISVMLKDSSQSDDRDAQSDDRFAWRRTARMETLQSQIITDQRVARDPPMLNPVIQFHGKWPFHRIVGIQEPFSVVFSLLNFLAHRHGLAKIYDCIPAGYSLRKYYVLFSYIGLTSWFFSIIFHTRDFNLTERLDYFAAGASVLYGLYYTPIRIFRLDQKEPPIKQTLLRLWSVTCVLLYVVHVTYLTCWSWDYTYNMAANVTVGVVQNILWSWFSVRRYQKLKQPWAAWPGLIVAWVVVAMSMELLDFPPIKGMVDAHSLWHLGTVGPTIWWYK